MRSISRHCQASATKQYAKTETESLQKKQSLTVESLALTHLQQTFYKIHNRKHATKRHKTARIHAILPQRQVVFH